SLLFVRGDPVGASRADLVDPVEIEQRAKITVQPSVAVHTPLVICLGVEVPIAALWAQPSAADWETRCGGDSVSIAHCEDRFADAVGAALMVDDRARTELRETKETRAREEAVASDPLAACRDVGEERQAWEVVAREKALGGEIPIGIEIT